MMIFKLTLMALSVFASSAFAQSQSSLGPIKTELVQIEIQAAQTFWQGNEYLKNSQSWSRMNLDMPSIKELNLRAIAIWDALLSCNNSDVNEAAQSFLNRGANCADQETDLLELHKNLYEFLISNRFDSIAFDDGEFQSPGKFPIHPMLKQIIINIYTSLIVADAHYRNVFTDPDLLQLLGLDLDQLKIEKENKDKRNERYYKTVDAFLANGGRNPIFGSWSLFSNETRELNKVIAEKRLDTEENEARTKKIYAPNERRDKVRDVLDSFMANIIFLLRHSAPWSERVKDCREFGLFQAQNAFSIHFFNINSNKYDFSRELVLLRRDVAKCHSDYTNIPFSQAYKHPGMLQLARANRNYFQRIKQ